MQNPPASFWKAKGEPSFWKGGRGAAAGSQQSRPQGGALSWRRFAPALEALRRRRPRAGGARALTVSFRPAVACFKGARVPRTALCLAMIGWCRLSIVAVSALAAW